MKSVFSLLITIPILVALLMYVWQIIRNPIPLPSYPRLAYLAGYWVLENNKGNHTKFEKVTIRFDGGLFVLLGLVGGERPKTIVVFNDQMTLSQNRILRIVGKIN